MKTRFFIPGPALLLLVLIVLQGCSTESPYAGITPCRAVMIIENGMPAHRFIYNDEGLDQVGNYQSGNTIQNYWQYYRENGRTVRMDLIGVQNSLVLRILLEYEGDRLARVIYQNNYTGTIIESHRRLYFYNAEGKVSSIEYYTGQGELVQVTHLTWQGNDLVNYEFTDVSGNLFITTQTFDTTYKAWDYYLGNDLVWKNDFPLSEHVVTSYSVVFQGLGIIDAINYTYTYNHYGLPVAIESSNFTLRQIQYECDE